MRKKIGRLIALGVLGIMPLSTLPAFARARHVEHRQAEPRRAPGLVVDVSRLRALGLGPTADVVQEALTRTLAGEAPPQPGATLVVKITAISLSAFNGTNSSGGGENGGLGGASNNDYLEGEILVVGPGGEVLNRFPQLMALPSTSGGPYYLPNSEFRRAEALSRDFGLWVKRRLG